MKSKEELNPRIDLPDGTPLVAQHKSVVGRHSSRLTHHAGTWDTRAASGVCFRLMLPPGIRIVELCTMGLQLEYCSRFSSIWQSSSPQAWSSKSRSIC